jgi:hypothetical protein
MAASDYVPIFFENRLHLAGRPQMSTRPIQRRIGKLQMSSRSEEICSTPESMNAGNMVPAISLTRISLTFGAIVDVGFWAPS